MGTSLHQIELLGTVQQQMLQGEITGIADEATSDYLINGHIRAKRSLSCLLVPEPQDLVLYWLDDRNQAWILSILAGQMTEARQLALMENQGLKINTDSLTVNAAKNIQLNAIEEININVALGRLNECARSAYKMIQGSLVQITKHFISQSEYLDFNAKKLLKSHSTQQLITAEKDIKMDADRINMG